ncbi:MAG: HAD-IA family hydrolase [Candidatus Colwellbacteria bacterium]|nr:HAD-IA family hydrolase [Candidatus Colwellbacteria bacterium]
MASEQTTRKIKSIYFDLDGTLVDTKHFHFISLNRALESIDKRFVISREEHISTYDGLSTTQKLKILSEKGLDSNLHNRIWELKQKYTNELIDELHFDDRLISMLKTLKEMGYTLYVVSNAIYTTVKNTLLRKGFMPYIDYFASNDDVASPKPHPEIYQKCLIRNKIYPSECLAIEDSPIGRESAFSAGCHLLSVNNPDDLTLEKILVTLKDLDHLSPRKMIKNTTKMNVIIPMSGNGSRFKIANYTFPKPLIEVHGKPMIQVVVDNLNCDPNTCKFIYIVQESHYTEYNLKYLLNLITPGCEIVRTNGITEGSTCSVLLAREFIDNDTPLLMANSDQFLEWNNHEFIYGMVSSGVDGGISTFTATHPKWSFAKVDGDGFVTEVAEKKPISDIATTGIYYWKRGSDFVKYADQMISKNIRTNGEFYICPVFNEAISDGKKIRISHCKNFHGIGTPEDLVYFLENYKGPV